jgi:hypothetical protein
MSMIWIKCGVLAAMFLGWSWLCYHQGSLAPQLKEAKAEVKSEQTQIQQDSKQTATNTQAEAQHDQDIEHPPTLVLKQPVWLRSPAICPAAVQVPVTAAGQPATERPADPGSRIDLRPQLAAFALKYEQALADCRRMAAEWPK